MRFAHSLVLEHRYYGFSYPFEDVTDVSTEKLTYLTSQQALAVGIELGPPCNLRSLLFALRSSLARLSLSLALLGSLVRQDVEQFLLYLKGLEKGRASDASTPALTLKHSLADSKVVSAFI